jgi:hypothetical protein
MEQLIDDAKGLGWNSGGARFGSGNFFVPASPFGQGGIAAPPGVPAPPAPPREAPRAGSGRGADRDRSDRDRDRDRDPVDR